jgi:hypothetical protein
MRRFLVIFEITEVSETTEQRLAGREVSADDGAQAAGAWLAIAMTDTEESSHGATSGNGFLRALCLLCGLPLS